MQGIIDVNVEEAMHDVHNMLHGAQLLGDQRHAAQASSDTKPLDEVRESIAFAENFCKCRIATSAPEEGRAA